MTDSMLLVVALGAALGFVWNATSLIGHRDCAHARGVICQDRFPAPHPADLPDQATRVAL